MQEIRESESEESKDDLQDPDLFIIKEELSGSFKLQLQDADEVLSQKKKDHAIKVEGSLDLSSESSISSDTCQSFSADDMD